MHRAALHTRPSRKLEPQMVESSETAPRCAFSMVKTGACMCHLIQHAGCQELVERSNAHCCVLVQGGGCTLAK